MKIAYLMHTKQTSQEIMKVLQELVRQDDHAFIMVDDNKIRDEVMIAASHERRIHVSHTQEFAQEGDMSLSRGTLLQMKEAMELEDVSFDYCINLYDGMLPLKARNEIVSFLTENPGDYYYVDHTQENDPVLLKETLKYYPYTNLLNFPDSKKVRRRSRHMSSLLNLLHIRRKLEDPVQIGSPWFMLTAPTCRVLAENFSYCSEFFKLSWYAEEMCYPMMITRFVKDSVHINEDKRVVGPDGHWEHSQGIRPITEEVLNNCPDALFGGAILEADQPELFDQYLPIYNSNFTEETEYPTDNSGFNQLVDAIADKTTKS